MSVTTLKASAFRLVVTRETELDHVPTVASWKPPGLTQRMAGRGSLSLLHPVTSPGLWFQLCLALAEQADGRSHGEWSAKYSQRAWPDPVTPLPLPLLCPGAGSWNAGQRQRWL